MDITVDHFLEVQYTDICKEENHILNDGWTTSVSVGGGSGEINVQVSQKVTKTFRDLRKQKADMLHLQQLTKKKKNLQ